MNNPLAIDDFNGSLGQPKWSGDFDVSYYHSGWRVRYGLEWIGSMDGYADAEEDPETSIYDFDLPNYYLSNFSVQYTDEENEWQATAGVRNAFDKEPPKLSSLFVNKVGNTLLYCVLAAGLDVEFGTAIADLILRPHLPARQWLFYMASAALSCPGPV